MTLIKWTPRQPSLFNNMDKMIHSVFNDDWNFPIKSMNWSPSIDVEETNDAFILTADIPGLTKKDVKVSVQDAVLTISGERLESSEKETGNFHYRERQVGKFKRSFNLPESVKDEDISASFKHGLLTLKLPKQEVQVPTEREIKIS